MATLKESAEKLNKELPSTALSAMLISLGIVAILVGVYSKNNILKATMFAYFVLP